MKGAARNCRLSALVFHDVDLAAPRPRNLVRVKPESGPHALRGGQIDSRFEAAGTVKRFRCDQSGSVKLIFRWLIGSSKLEISVANRHLLRPVVLLFVVLAILTVERLPIRCVEAAAVEF